MTGTEAVCLIVVPLAFTVLIEALVAALLGLKDRAVGAVVVVNLVTNPLVNLLVLSLYAHEVGFAEVEGTQYIGEFGYGTITTVVAPWMWVLLAAIEVIVVLVEWRALAWVLAGRAGSSRKLLMVSIVMNLVTAVVGTLVVSHFVLA